MLMRDTEIKQALDSKELEITPFRDERLQGASYDLSVGGEAFVSNSDRKILLSGNSNKPICLKPGDFALVITDEYVKMPLNVAAAIGMRSTLARQGLMLLAGMQIDPGFEGHLRFGLYNASPRKIYLDYNDPLCTIELHRLSGNVERPQETNQDLKNGKIPESDRAFLRALETTSLSEIGENMRSLIQSVDTLTKVAYLFLIPAIIAILVAVTVAVINGLLK